MITRRNCGTGAVPCKILSTNTYGRGSPSTRMTSENFRACTPKFTQIRPNTQAGTESLPQHLRLDRTPPVTEAPPARLVCRVHVFYNRPGQMKTNASRQLDKLGIPYELRNYKVDLEDLSALKVAAEIGLPARQVFKTLVARGNLTGVLLAVIPGDRELDLKALARVSSNRRIELAPLDQLQHLTGYIRGGVTALARRKNYPVYLDSSAQEFDTISISAGVRGTQILIAPRDYLKATGATLGCFSRSAI